MGDNLVEEYTLEDLQEGKVKPFFNSMEHEYEIINKYGRGLWDEHSIRSAFNLADQDIIIKIDEGYGAFDY